MKIDKTINNRSLDDFNIYNGVHDFFLNKFKYDVSIVIESE